jgi:glycosyltransferase involved in cell wall biosynthesis
MRADAVKVAIIAGQLDQGGSERQLYLWLAGLDRDEFDPVVLNLHPGATAHWQEHIAELDVRVIDVPRQRNRGMRSLRVAHAVRKLRPQLVHSWHLHTNWYAAVAARASGARSLGSCRGSPSSIRSAGPIAAAFPALNGMVANSAETVEALRHADFFGRPVFHVRNGLVDWEHDRAGARRHARELGLDTDAVLVAVLGRVVSEKGLDDLVGVAARVVDAAAHPVQFAVIGEGRDRERLEEDARRAGLGAAVKYVGPVADAARMLDGFDVLLHLSGDEGLPNAPLEAAAASLPVVTWDLPYAHEVLSTDCAAFAR